MRPLGVIDGPFYVWEMQLPIRFGDDELDSVSDLRRHEHILSCHMSEPQNDDETKFNETLKRMLDTPPKPHKGTGAGNSPLTGAAHKKKPGGPPAKKDRPE